METTINNIVFEWDEEKIEQTFANIILILTTPQKFSLMKIAFDENRVERLD